MTYILFQQEADPTLKSPWPVLFQGTEIISGRPDASRIFGFTDNPTPGAGDTLYAGNGIESPDDLIGMYPIFQEASSLFVIPQKIISAREWQGKDEDADLLRRSTAARREELRKSGTIQIAQAFTVIGILDGFGSPWTIAAFAGETEVTLGEDDHWTLVVQALNGQEALRLAREQKDAELADVEA